MEEGIQCLVPGMMYAQALVKRFEQEFGTSDCFEIAGVDWTNVEEAYKAIMDQEFLEECAQIVAITAGMVADIIGEES
ncbi:MAG: C-GCAxxG-C-C family protein [Dehalococcoidia bacterium]|nr:C-GCAxxG-C-C family protein [Dehalococcoidia bacterium]